MRTRMSGKRIPSRQHGAVAVLVALFLVALLGFGALAVDFARYFVVKNELQNAADAAALAGAGALSGPGGATYATPNWMQAAADATRAIALNSAGGSRLLEGDVETGYWSVKQEPHLGLQPTSITPDIFQKPAVMVTIKRMADTNGGPMKLFLASVIGISTLSLSATAVAVISAPGYAEPHSVFPVAITKCLYETYFKNGKPVNDPTTGQPYEFKIGSSYHYDACFSGEWTTFNQEANNVGAARDLIVNGNPVGMAIGDKTWIQPGTENTLYNSVPVQTDTLIPVVVDLGTHNYAPIVAFAPFHITAAVGGSEKYIQGHFITNYKAPGTTAGAGGGTFYGAFVPPVLAF